MTDMALEREMCSLLLWQPEKGLEQIMNRYTAFVYTIVHGKLSGICKSQDIEECVSDIFYELYRTRNTIDFEKGSLKAYLAVLSKRKAIDVYRKKRGRSETVSIDEFDHDWIASGADVEGTVIVGETNDILINEINALGEPDSQIMIRKYYFGQSTKIIASALGIKANTIDQKASRALVKLRHALGGAF